MSEARDAVVVCDDYRKGPMTWASAVRQCEKLNAADSLCRLDHRVEHAR